jgi:hypothetical protein
MSSFGGAGRTLYEAEFNAVTDGSEENKKFFEWTPSGSLKIGVYREDIFQPGQDYYLDISEAKAVPGPQDPPRPANHFPVG